MLISMPTGTSTIFGVFQVIGSSQQVWRDARARAEPRDLPHVAQVRNSHSAYALRGETSLPDKAASLPVKARKIFLAVTYSHYSRSGQARAQQSLPAIFKSGLAPCASCAAVG